MTKLQRFQAFRPSDPSASAPVDAILRSRPANLADVEAEMRIVVVDDDEDIREQLADILNKPAFSVRVTASAAEFYDVVEFFDAHVAIIDLSLPASDGVDILKRLRDIRFGGEVVIMSGRDRHVLETTRRIALDYGLAVSGILLKPFAAQDLLAVVDRSSGQGGVSDTRIRAAIAAQQIRPYFQPKLDLKTARIVGAEALSRWHHPERGILLPGGYMKAVRTAGTQSVHDYRILESTLALCAKTNASGRKLKYSVNFTADDVQGDYFLDVIKDAQNRHGVDPGQLVIELTETETVENFEGLAEKLIKLRLHGTEISIDDFGTGHSSLSRVQRLPVSEIKIDRSFISGLTDYSEDYAIVRSIVELSHSFGCLVVAEGVETLEGLAVLHKLGCDLVQGHLFSPAVNDATFCALIDSEFPAFSILKAVDAEADSTEEKPGASERE